MDIGIAGKRVSRSEAEPVGVSQVRQLGALDDGGFDLGPVARRQDEGHDIELPGPGLAAAVVIDVIGDAIVLHRGAGGRLAALILFRRQARQGAGEGAPSRAEVVAL